MHKIIRTIEILVGLLFILAAALKALDMTAFATQIRFYGVLYDMNAIRTAAVGSVVAETLLGTALLVGLQPRALVYGLVLAMLVGFSGLVAYADVYHNLDDCGCFGKFLAMDPVQTIAKNLVMIALVIGAWAMWRRTAGRMADAPSRRRIYTGAVGAALAVVAACYAFADNQEFLKGAKGNAERPFAQFALEHDGETLDLGEGTYLAALLSATCDDCREAVIPLSDLTYYPDVPQVAVLMLATEEEYAAFLDEMQPMFPSTRIDPMAFFALIGDEPPRFYVVEDGAPVRHIDTLDPTIDLLYDFAHDPDWRP